MTQTQVAKQLNISEKTLRKYLKKQKTPPVSVLISIIQLFHIAPTSIFSSDTHEELSPIEHLFIMIYRNLSVSERKRLSHLLKKYKNNIH